MVNPGPSCQGFTCTVPQVPKVLKSSTFHFTPSADPKGSPNVTMDAPENELDVKLHRASGDLIAAFDDRLGPFLRKLDDSGGYRIRSCVRTREAVHLMSNVSQQDGAVRSVATNT